MEALHKSSLRWLLCTSSYCLHKAYSRPLLSFVRVVGLEPTRGFPRKILSLLRMPIPPYPLAVKLKSQARLMF